MRYCASGAHSLASIGGGAAAVAHRYAAPETGTRRDSSVARLRLADRAAAEELFAALYPRLAGWCRRLVDDDETAHEIASEAFTRLWARWTSVAEPRGFLYVTAANLVRDHWRKLERERRAVRRATTEAAVAPHPEQTDPSVRLLVQSL